MVKPPWIRPLSPLEVSRTLADDLVPVADDLRMLATEFGVRPYRVFLVWVGWSNVDPATGLAVPEIDSATRNAGFARLLLEREILPTPKLAPFTLQQELRATGLTEAGNIRVTRISASFSEDVLMGTLPEFRHPDHPETLRGDVSFFWEIFEDRPARFRDQYTQQADLPTDRPSYRTRYTVSSKPTLHRGGFHWIVSLTRADGERDRYGQIANGC